MLRNLLNNAEMSVSDLIEKTMRSIEKKERKLVAGLTEEKILSLIDSILVPEYTVDQFITKIETALQDKEKHIKDSSTSLSFGVASLQPAEMKVPSIGNLVKGTVRNELINQVKEKLQAHPPRLSILDALEELLTSIIGSHERHSFKYMLLRGLFSDDLPPEPNADETNGTIDAFIAAIKIKQAALKEIRQAHVKTIVDGINDSVIHRQVLADIIQKELNDPSNRLGNHANGEGETVEQPLTRSSDEKNVNEQPTFIDMFNMFSEKATDTTKYVTKLSKATAREWMLKPLIKELRDGRITIIDALNKILNSPIGQTGPHSFTYTVLVELFGRKPNMSADKICLEKEDAIRSKEYIDLFKEEIGRHVSSVARDALEGVLSHVSSLNPFRSTHD